MRVLIVEDEVRLSEALGQILREQKYAVDAVFTGEDGLYYAQNGSYDVILLDVMLPGRDGFQVVRQLRADKVATPVILLTALDEISNKITGLDCGADDYITKPFVPEELLARVRAAARRTGDVVVETLSFGDLCLHLSTNTLHCGHRSVHLGFKEFQVLRMLMQNPSIIVPKEDIIVQVWGAESGAEDNNVEAYISFLRKKIFYLCSSVLIEAVRKVGYRLEGAGKS